MNHQPFREWIFSEEKLSAEQTKVLEEHLNSCESCSHLDNAWSEVESVFQQSPQLSPPAGFTARWQVHLAEYQLTKQKTRVWTTMGISTIFIISLLVVMIYQLRSFIHSPDQYVAIWFNSLISLVSIYYAFVDKVHFGMTNLPVYTFIGMFFLVGMISFMSVLWLAAYRKLSMVWRAI
jgi:predicted anti-sigma-YlaC factor YlaD